MKVNKTCLTNLASAILFCFSLYECERVMLARKSSQALGVHAASNFKAVIRMILMCDNKVITEHATLSKKTFRLGIGGIKGISTRPKPLSMEIQVMCIP